MPTRETVMNALLAQVATATSFKTVSRYITLIPGAPTPQPATPPLQPAIYLLEDHEETARTGRGSPPVRTWFVVLWVYCKSPTGNTPGISDGVTPGLSSINPLIDAIEATLAPDNMATNEFTLGGLVQYCRIEGQTAKATGDLNPDGQCFAAIPIKILVP